MHLLKPVVGCILSAVAVAESSSLYFTNHPNNVKVGQPVIVRYMAPEIDQPVQIILRKGMPANLDTVGTLTSSATGGSFSWIPAQTLQPGHDYALQIKQSDQINYSGEFAVSKGSGAVTTNSVSTIASTAGRSVPASSIPPSAISSIFASVMSTTNATTTAVPLAPVLGPVASGTGGIPAARNATFSPASLTPTVPAESRVPAAIGSLAPSPNGVTSIQVSGLIIIGALTAVLQLV